MLFRDRAHITLDQVDSTNNYAANLLKVSIPPDGTVITAQQQTMGKGQRGASWDSEPGENILCSIISYPKFLAIRSQFYLSKSVSLAVAEMLEDVLQTDVFIKWPNDIIVAEKKIAGLLLEFNWLEGRIQSAISGIGININQEYFDHPKAISVQQVTGKKYDTAHCLHRLIQSFDKHYLQLQSGFYSEVDRAYRSRLFRFNQPSQFIYNDGPINGTIAGVDESGKLIIITEDEKSIACNLKEITLVY